MNRYGLLARIHPELVPVRKDQEPEQRPGPRPTWDERPEWVRRAQERRLPAADLTGRAA